MIAIVDAGLGNLRSVLRALKAAGADDARLVTNANEVRDAERIVMPGQGAFGDCARALRPDEPLGRALCDSIAAGKPYLGICLGLQVLFDSSEESPGHPGLGVFPGRVARLPSGAVDTDGRRLKVPHIGWSQVAFRGHHAVLGVTSDAWFYFVHSFHARPVDDKLVAGICAFGDMPLTSAVARDNVIGVQFHPEKSQIAGIELLRAFFELAMLIIPAIDLLGGKVVRLVEGKRDRATVYSDSPADVARAFRDAGATRLHVVDLDGAFSGRAENRRAVSEIVALGLPVQLGGGIRDLATCERLINEGVRQIVTGTIAVKQPDLFHEILEALPGRVIVAVDARDGKVAVEGWAEATTVDAFDLAAESVEAGAAAILYTDISRDGTGVGPNVESSGKLARVLHPVPVIASGGIGSLAHLRELALAGLPQAVVGRALYENSFTLEQALALAGTQP